MATVQCDCEKDLTKAYQRTHSSAVVRPDGTTVECSLEKIERVIKKGGSSSIDAVKKDLLKLAERVASLESGEGMSAVPREMAVTYEDGTSEVLNILTVAVEEV